jgi:tetratricopeptide (TPR) repeat protein
VTRATVVLASWLAIAARAHADAPVEPTDQAASSPAQPHVAAATAAFQRADYRVARDELLAAYELEPRPELLFALGQAEYNLGEYQQALAYYERFTASGPPPEQAALAQQAIGAARARLLAKPVPAPNGHVVIGHRWSTLDSTLAISGGGAIVGGTGLILAGVVLSHDDSGTLHSFDRRLHDASILRTAGVAVAATGALAIGAALLHWRIHHFETIVYAQPRLTAVALARAW